MGRSRSEVYAQPGGLPGLRKMATQLTLPLVLLLLVPKALVAENGQNETDLYIMQISMDSMNLNSHVLQFAFDMVNNNTRILPGYRLGMVSRNTYNRVSVFAHCNIVFPDRRARGSGKCSAVPSTAVF